MRITAELARELSSSTIDIEETVNSVYALIHDAAVKNRRYVCLRGKFWAVGGLYFSTEWAAAVELLKKDGFKVDFIHNGDDNDDNDMYTIVSW